MEQIRQVTGQRFSLKDWETVNVCQIHDSIIMVQIETYDVRVLVREDQYNKKGVRYLAFVKSGGRWGLETDMTVWDESFVPYVYEKIGRRKTADEIIAQREYEKMCYRPGNSRNPLDSYDRVLDPTVRSTPRMEKHF